MGKSTSSLDNYRWRTASITMRSHSSLFYTIFLISFVNVIGHAFLMGCFDDIKETSEIHDRRIVPFAQGPLMSIEAKLVPEPTETMHHNEEYKDGNSTTFYYPANTRSLFDLRIRVPEQLSHVQSLEYMIEIAEGNASFVDKSRRCKGKRSHAPSHRKPVQLQVYGTSDHVTLHGIWSWSSEETYLTEPLTFHRRRSSESLSQDEVGDKSSSPAQIVEPGTIRDEL